MGAVQSDLKANIVQASAGGKAIPPGDEDYWQTFWTRPETPEHVYETFTQTDIRGMRDDPVAIDNLKTLILKSTLKILSYRSKSPSLSEENARLGTQLLNCVRILTRILPYVYEADAVRAWEEEVFWQPQQASTFQKYAKDVSEYLAPEENLGTQLVDALLELLFYTGFTLPWSDTIPQDGRKGQITYGLWQSGIACDTTVLTTRELESRRTEILQLILVLESKGLYLDPGQYINTEVQAVQHIVQHHDKKRVQALLCSLLNTIIKYHPDSWLGFDPRSPQGDSLRELHVKTCLQFLLINMLNRAPWKDEGRDKNEFRLQFSYLHKPTHFQFLVDGIFKILRQPVEPAANVLSMGLKSSALASEMILLLWEAIYTNKKYRQYITKSGRALDLMVLLLYYAKESQMEGVGRVCVFCLQTLSAEPSFGQSLNRSFDAHNTLPVSIQVKNFHGQYSDYFITSVLSLLEFNSMEASFWSVSLMAIINNVAPEVTNLARATSSKLMQTFARMAKPSFVLASELNVTLLAALLDAINAFIECHAQEPANLNLLYAIWRARTRFEALRELCLQDGEELGSAGTQSSTSPPSVRSSPDETTPTPHSEKAKGKRPFVHQNVSPAVMRKLADLPLHTLLTLINNVNEQISSLPDADADQEPMTPNDSRRSSFASTRGSDRTPSDVLRIVHETGLIGIEQRKPVIDVFRFQKSIASLYASFYWGLLVSSDIRRANDSGKGIWVGTNIKLFKIKAGEVQGPSLWSPWGAVDAVGESLVAGVRDLTIRARKSLGGEGT